MKIKLDHVTNSSSTGFIFIWKGDKIDLIKAIESHASEFDLSYEDSYSSPRSCNVWDVIKVIEDSFQHAEKEGIDERIKKCSKLEEELENERRKPYKEGNTTIEWMEYNICEKNLPALREAKKKGLTNVIAIGFGDEDGTDVGFVMDYEGRSLDINDDNLIMVTEQWR